MMYNVTTFATHYEIPEDIKFDYEDNIKNMDTFFLLLKLNHPELDYFIEEMKEEAFRLKKSFEDDLSILIYRHYPDMPNIILKIFVWDSTVNGNDYWSELHSDFESRCLDLKNKYKWEYAVNKKNANKEIIKITL